MSTSPFFTKTMRPVAVKGFEVEAREYKVCGVAFKFVSRFAQPNDASQIIFPSLDAATDTDGVFDRLIRDCIVEATDLKLYLSD